ncbi:MAG: phosphoribosylformylglycinamidine synthase I [Planctomycetaceae bacterium]|nr:phosphoribosylformylglycinamidine synthase I [Planctomycetales bacterium]MCB9874018.1 phosphoribosylformylglycinamidine synthase I [Planctomycetaceae bacterium]MCB9941212.1 phosphoribosylformylglycinamidine synthase I [Planctomycetaceae bacterium]HRX79026.1 phosphoribosylformylglycinamidine synthase I [Pirellulaceae bacterium]
MPTPRVLILRAPGTNCDLESAYAFELAGGKADSVHINQLLETPSLPSQYQILCLPGGFSYGDDISAGRILGNQIRHHLQETLVEFKSAGKLILGICNGFQILIRSGILLADDEQGEPATLTWNASGKFEDRWVKLSVDGHKSVFLNGIESMYLPVAHAEGKFVTRSTALLDHLKAEGQLALRYKSLHQSNGHVPYPDNPNGSLADVAGVCDETGRVFGLMPHPERFVDPTQHPRWTREGLQECGDGLLMFQNAVRYFAN